ncbi:LacI family transcriptional regulator [Fulvivirga ulvae]|uniref:LacI family DNA-binding transcriptional regulator n=1 Tax=Fulvivirga ulvae TaxID=2904245 RepID=UPI001F31AE4C|nr:LacI family DNA-binding transcriptional regulator [Fulvivirga ulvae]UII34642.1 LacI family transcriptional regulator [Fulvivirga ulvae]
MGKGQVTIRDIALKLNISISTVSRAMRGMADVNPETKKKVLEMASQLNYEPNLIAQSLRINRTNTIGIIVPDVEVHFFSSIVSGIQEVASEVNYNVLFCQSNENYQTELNNLKTLIASRVDGLLISLSRETEDMEHLLRVQRKNIPLVLFDRISDDIDTSKVNVSDMDGAFKAVKYLVDTGCRRIAYLAGPKNLAISNKRMDGYFKALRVCGITPDENLIVHCNSLRDDAGNATDKLLALKEKPDGIFCVNDPVALQAMQVVKQHGFKIPEDISIIGFTDDPVSALVEPALTTVAQPSHEMGKCAAKLLIDQIKGYNGASRTVTLDTKLVLRGTTRALRET